MREIKFRIWIKKEKKMLYDWRATANAYFTNGFMYRRSEIELMQYVGLKDINKKEIFEEDIVKVPSGYGGDNYYPEWFGIVKYEYSGYEVIPINEKDYGCQDFSFEDIEIVGNIYENSELVNK